MGNCNSSSNTTPTRGNSRNGVSSNNTNNQNIIFHPPQGAAATRTEQGERVVGVASTLFPSAPLTLSSHHEQDQEQARPSINTTPQSLVISDLRSSSNRSHNDDTGGRNNLSSLLSRVRVSSNLRSSSGRSLRRLVDLAVGPRRQQSENSIALEGSGERRRRSEEQQRVIQSGVALSAATSTTTTTRQNPIVVENESRRQNSSSSSNSDTNQPTWSVSSTDEQINSLDDHIRSVIDQTSQVVREDQELQQSRGINDIAGVESTNTNGSTSTTPNGTDSSNSSTSTNPYSVSLGFSPLGVSATRRQTSGTPRLIFRRPLRSSTGTVNRDTSRNNNYNTRHISRSNNNNSTRGIVRNTLASASVGGGGRFRTSWQASDLSGGEHYFFTYSAPHTSRSPGSSASAGAGAVDGVGRSSRNSGGRYIRSTSNASRSTTSSSLSASGREGAAASPSLSSASPFATGTSRSTENDPFSTYDARLRRRLRAARASREATARPASSTRSQGTLNQFLQAQQQQNHASSSLLSSDLANNSLQNTSNHQRRRRRRTFQLGNISHRNNGGDSSNRSHSNNRTGSTVEAYGPAIFPRREEDNNSNTPTTNNTTGSALDLEELYRELRVMEHLFANLFPGAGNLFEAAAQEAAFQASWNAANVDPQNSTGPPPASAKAIRQLPTIQVAEIDLIDESNRECCICFEPHNLGDKLTRLPCGHLFHGPCVQEWLHKHCTCPVCRYELETNNPQYEIGRKERMKHRKPRYHRYELERMTVRELRDLMNKCSIAVAKGTATEKKDLVDLIVNSGRIIVISTASVPNHDTSSSVPGSPAAAASATSSPATSPPSPAEAVHFTLSELRRISIGSLKQIMADHGVFYDPADVVEKEDMVQIFINSGRCIVIPEDDEMDHDHEEGGSASRRENSDDSGGNNHHDQDHGTGSAQPMNDEMDLNDRQENDLDDGHMVEHEEMSESHQNIDRDHTTNRANDEREMAISETVGGVETASGFTSLESSIVDVLNYGGGSGIINDADDLQQEDGQVATDENHASVPNSFANQPTTNSNEEDWEMVDDNNVEASRTTNASVGSSSSRSTFAVAAAAAAVAAPKHTSTSSSSRDKHEEARHLTSLSISQLKQLAYELNVNVNDCLEKREMIERIADAAMARRLNVTSAQ